MKPTSDASSRLAARLYRGLVTGSAVTTALIEKDFTIGWISESVVDLMGFTAEALIGTSAIDLVHPDDRPALDALVAYELQNPADFIRRSDPARLLLNQLRLRSWDGSWVTVDMAANNETGNPAVEAFIVQLVPRQTRASYDEVVDAIFLRQPACEIANMLAATVESAITRGVVVISIDGNYNRCHQNLIRAADRMQHEKQSECVTSRGSLWQIPVLLDSEIVGSITVAVPLEMSLSMWTKAALKDLAPLIAHTVRRDRVESRLTEEASTDPLTGLANRRSFFRATARVSESLRALIYIDLDGFKIVNDILGHDAGDLYLIQAAARIASALRPSDIVARFGGDEFVVCCEVDSSEEAMLIAERIANRLSADLFVISGEALRLSATIGVAVGRDEPISTLLQRADVAMVTQKQTQKGVAALSTGPVPDTDRHYPQFTNQLGLDLDRTAV